MLVKKRHGIAAQIVYLHPAVANAAQGQQLHRVGQAFAGLNHCLEKRALWQMPLGQLNHIPAHKQAGSGITVKILSQTAKFVKSIGADIHALLQKMLPYATDGGLCSEFV